MTDWTVRPATATDHEAIGALTVAVYASVGPLHPDYEARLRDVTARAAHCEFYVAVEGPVLAGSVAFVPAPGPESSIARADEAEMRTLAVAPAYGGHGIGEALVRLCLLRAWELRRTAVVLSSMPWMTGAHRLYERIGFRRTPDRDWSPRPGFDCVTYMLEP